MVLNIRGLGQQALARLQHRPRAWDPGGIQDEQLCTRGRQPGGVAEGHCQPTEIFHEECNIGACIFTPCTRLLSDRYIEHTDMGSWRKLAGLRLEEE